MPENKYKPQSEQQKPIMQFGFPKMLLTLDQFGAPLPGFNVKGEDSVRTYCGGLVSLLIMLLAFLFATLKLQQLLSKGNPSVNNYVQRDAFDENDIWRGNENEDFQMAFAVVNYVSGDVKYDS